MIIVTRSIVAKDKSRARTSHTRQLIIRVSSPLYQRYSLQRRSHKISKRLIYCFISKQTCMPTYDDNFRDGTDQGQHVHPTSFRVRQNVWRTSDPYFDTSNVVG